MELAEGECYGLLGPNGAGKTTSISMLCGLLVPDAGEVTANGQRLTPGATAPKAAIGYVPQDIALYPELTARENPVLGEADLVKLAVDGDSALAHAYGELEEVLDATAVPGGFESGSVASRRTMVRRLDVGGRSSPGRHDAGRAAAAAAGPRRVQASARALSANDPRSNSARARRRARSAGRSPWSVSIDSPSERS